MVDVFISYKKERRLHAQRLAVIFEARGYDIWWDHGLLPGGQFDEQIVEKLTAAKAVVVVWCSGAIRSGFVKSEARRAFRERKLIQAHIEDVEAPIGLDGDQSQSLVTWSGNPDHEAISKILLPIGRLVGRGARTSPNVIDALSAFLPALPRVEPISTVEEDETEDERTPAKPEGTIGDRETVFFQACRTADDFEAYVSKFPNGDFIPIAQNRIRELDDAWISQLAISREEWSTSERLALLAKLGSRAARADVEPRARRGNAIANTILGMQFVEAGDFAQAYTHYSAAAEAGFPRAQAALAVLYSKGDGVTQDLAKAAHWNRRAAEAGNAFGQHNFALALELGRGLDIDVERAKKWYLRAAEQELPDAECMLGHFCEREKEGLEAVSWFEKAASRGFPRGQWLAGRAYDLGTLVPKDPAKAIYWFKLSAEQGHAWGQLALGNSHAEGRGTPKNLVEAVKWWRRSAGQGLATAQYKLGKALETGQGIAKDLAEAREWYSKALEQNHSAASKAIKRLDAIEEKTGSQETL